MIGTFVVQREIAKEFCNTLKPMLFVRKYSTTLIPSLSLLLIIFISYARCYLLLYSMGFADMCFLHRNPVYIEMRYDFQVRAMNTTP